MGEFYQEMDNGLACTYSYDDLFRLTNTTDRTGAYYWEFDNAGNRTFDPGNCRSSQTATNSRTVFGCTPGWVAAEN